MTNPIPATLGPYSVESEVYRSRNTTIFRARKQADGPLMILKVPTQAQDSEALQRIATERDLLKSLEISGVPTIDPSAPEGVLARPFVPGLPLAEVLRDLANPVPIEQALDMMIRLSRILASVHRAGISHRDLHPANILFDQESGEINIIDFGLASRNDFTSARLLPPQQLEGTLRYMAPEQTGRMNRGVDYRADLYSLGASCYELLTGRVPFASNDAMELVHAHLALAPTPPVTLRPEIPAPLSDVVLKLLAKSPEERYQSADGLHFDLQQIKERPAGEETFILGTQDAPLRFEISAQLYGRDEERAQILNGFAQVRNHGKQLWLVGGPSGMGKSALAAELHRPITEARGLFLSGKFEQLHQGLTHVAWRQALEQLSQHILSEPEEILAAWRTALSGALGNNGRVLTDLSPGLEQVLGEQPALTELDSMEAQNRFHLVLRRFFGALANPDRPIVLFLDDWQWADQASIYLLQELLQDPELNHVLFVCAFRDNEVGPSDLFYQAFLDEAENATASWDRQRITLKPLQPEHICDLLRDTLRQEPEYMNLLATRLYEKTLGNAFFLHQLLKSLHQQEILHLEEVEGRLQWQLNQPALEALHITDNVVDFMMEKLQELPEQSLNGMKVAACIGNRFSAALLGDVMEVELEELRTRLAAAEKARLLVPLSGPQGNPTHYRFVHDSIQKACYELIPNQERAPTYLRLARRWEMRMPETPTGAALFSIVNAYNTAIDLLTDPNDRVRVATFNLRAAEEADRLPAYDTALAHARSGLTLLNPQHWQSHYTLMRDLHMLALKTGYFLNIDNDAQDWLDALLQNTESTVDRALCLELKMDYQKAKNQYADAMATGLEVMDLLGQKLPKPIIPVLLVAILRTRFWLYRYGIDNLLKHKINEDSLAEARERIALNLGNVTYVAKPEYNPLLTQKLIRGILKNGHTEYSPFSIVSFGLVIIAALNDLHYGKRLAEVSLRLMAKLKPGRWEGRTRFMYNTFIGQWFEPLRDVAKWQEDSYYLCVQTGDFEFASFAILTGVFQSFIAGAPLGSLKEKARMYQKEHRDTLGIPAKYDEFITIHLQPSLLTGDMSGLERWDGAPYDLEVLIADFEEAKNELSLAGLYWTYMVVYLILNKVEDAWKYCELHGTIGYNEATVGWGQHMMFRCLIMVRRWEVYSAPEKRKLRRFFAQTIRRFKKWTKINPRNFKHKYHFLLAEQARLQGHTGKALAHYHEAIVAASVLQILHETGMIYERIASLHAQQNQPEASRLHLREAYRVYQRWQSPVKLQQLEEQYPDVLGQSPDSFTQTLTHSSGRGPDLDLMSFIKSSQAISGELKLQQLLEKMLEVVIENVGAQRGVLLLSQKQQLQIQGEIDFRSNQRVFGAEGAARRMEDQVPSSVVYYVARSGKEVVLSDPHEAGKYQHDSYFRQKQPRNVLVVPLRKQRQNLGVLYLEHFEAPTMFGSERQEALRLLTSQIAISLDNALLYEDLEGKVAERTQEVVAQNQLIEAQKEQLEDASEKVMASIRAAKDIQRAMLMPLPEVQQLLPQSFVLFKPRDVVSGDFYWVREWQGKIYIAAVDCTGHGVPGALVSMVGNNLLDEILTKKQITSPEAMLDELQRSVRISLRQQDSQNRDGMDLALVVWDPDGKELHFSGARNPLVYSQNGELHHIKADRRSIGGQLDRKQVESTFTLHTVSLAAADGGTIPTTFYLYSDGYQDQFGGAGKTKFGSRRFRETLAEVCHLPMEQQYKKLDECLLSWMYAGQEDQVDDVLLIGVKVE